MKLIRKHPFVIYITKFVLYDKQAIETMSLILGGDFFGYYYFSTYDWIILFVNSKKRYVLENDYIIWRYFCTMFYLIPITCNKHITIQLLGGQQHDKIH